jgi:hypothetical protein
MNEIKIQIENLSVEAEVYDTPSGEAILAALPLEARVNVWGEEIYFDVPVRLDVETDAREVVNVGDLGYWPAGPAFCVFFGPTPVSQGTEPRAYSPVNIFGKVKGDARILTQVADGASVKVTAI